MNPLLTSTVKELDTIEKNIVDSFLFLEIQERIVFTIKAHCYIQNNLKLNDTILLEFIATSENCVEIYVTVNNTEHQNLNEFLNQNLTDTIGRNLTETTGRYKPAQFIFQNNETGLDSLHNFLINNPKEYEIWKIKNRHAQLELHLPQKTTENRKNKI